MGRFLNNAILALFVSAGTSQAASQPGSPCMPREVYARYGLSDTDSRPHIPLKLVKPTGGEHFSINDTVSIVWEYDPAIIGFTAVLVSGDSGQTWYEILRRTTAGTTLSLDSLHWVPADGPVVLADRAGMIMVRDYAKTYIDKSNFFSVSGSDAIVHLKNDVVDATRFSIYRHYISINTCNTSNTYTAVLYTVSGRLLVSARIPRSAGNFRLPLNRIAGQQLVLWLFSSDKTNAHEGFLFLSPHD